MPFHEALPRGFSWAIAFSAAAVPTVFMLSAVDWNSNPKRVKTIIGLLAFILISVAPIFTVFFIGPDLQNSRYIQLASAAWVIALAVAGDVSNRYATVFTTAVFVLLIGVFTITQRHHLWHWQRAAIQRDSLINAAKRLSVGCDGRIAMGQIPDSSNGAYVLRNGAREALAAEDIRVVDVSVVIPDCILRQPSDPEK